MIKVKDIYDFINEISPYNTKCDWDNCGLLVGDSQKEVKKIGFCLDATKETLSEAVKNGVDLIVTHHPVIFKPQKNFLKGNIAFEAATAGISIIYAHTCFDFAEGGINDVLAEILELENVLPLEGSDGELPMGRIGDIDEMTSLDFAKHVSKKLGTVCRVVDCENKIKKVAVCGGAGMDFVFDAVKMGADAYVTGDISHHQMLDAKDLGITVVAAGHFETENPAMKAMMSFVNNKVPDVETILLNQSNPVKFIG